MHRRWDQEGVFCRGRVVLGWLGPLGLVQGQEGSRAECVARVWC